MYPKLFTVYSGENHRFIFYLLLVWCMLLNINNKFFFFDTKAKRCYSIDSTFYTLSPLNFFTVLKYFSTKDSTILFDFQSNVVEITSHDLRNKDYFRHY